VLALIALVLAVGIADSINPSTVAPALYLATRRDAARSIAAFAAGAFVVYTAGGLLLVLGPGQAALAELPHPDAEATHRIELGAGVALLVFAVITWLARERIARMLVREESATRSSSSFIVGATIMTFELPTAFPYFAVIAAVVGSGRSLGVQIPLIVLFNVAFVAPLVAIAVLRHTAGPRAVRVLDAARIQLDRRGALLISGLMLVLGLVALFIGLVGIFGS
jgi:cytochrome c biogenesis protein CcdA